jgi:hypothetical protein
MKHHLSYTSLLFVLLLAFVTSCNNTTEEKKTDPNNTVVNINNNTFVISTVVDSGVKVFNPTTNKEETTNAVGSRPITMNGKKIYAKNENNTLPRLTPSGQQIVNELSAFFMQRFTDLPKDWKIDFNEFVIDEGGKVVYFNFGVSGGNSVEEMKKYTTRMHPAMDSLQSKFYGITFEPMMVNGTRVPYFVGSISGLP